MNGRFGLIGTDSLPWQTAGANFETESHYGLSSFDWTYSWGDQVVCELPSSAKRGISRALLGGWQSAGILVMQSCQRLRAAFQCCTISHLLTLGNDPRALMIVRSDKFKDSTAFVV